LLAAWPEAGLASYDGGSWLLSPGYFTARGRRPRGPQHVVPVAAPASTLEDDGGEAVEQDPVLAVPGHGPR
jgi:hypothetical protein